MATVLGYTSPNFMTSTLTINGFSFSWVNGGTQPIASIGYTAPWSGFDTLLQNFYNVASGISMTQGWYIDFTPNVATPTDWSTPLPSMTGTDITFNGGTFSYFTDQYQETFDLGVTSVNYSGDVSVVPEPSTWAMMLIGLVGLALVKLGRSRPAEA